MRDTAISDQDGVALFDEPAHAVFGAQTLKSSGALVRTEPSWLNADCAARSPNAAHPLPSKPDGAGRVERTHAWQNAFNRLQRRYEQRETVIDAFFGLADAIITVRKIIRNALTTVAQPTQATPKITYPCAHLSGTSTADDVPVQRVGRQGLYPVRRGRDRPPGGGRPIESHGRNTRRVPFPGGA